MALVLVLLVILIRSIMINQHTLRLYRSPKEVEHHVELTTVLGERPFPAVRYCDVRIEFSRRAREKTEDGAELTVD